MYISRQIAKNIKLHLLHRKEILIVYGARQVGKSTLIHKILDGLALRSLRIVGEELRYQAIFSSRNLNSMLEVVEGYELLFIDEAQYIESIGINIKLLHDAQPNLKIILSGSSSFELANRIKEPLTGRTKTYLLFPLGFSEIQKRYNKFELKEHLQQYLLYGGYPRLYHFENKSEKISALMEMASSYLYKDILMFNNLRNAGMLYDLLKLLAFQIGHPVSIHELSKKLKTSSETVERYIDLLVQSFVIYRLKGFSKNQRKEVSKMDKIYFVDLGIRNSIIENFAPLQIRNDVGQLWENFLISERLKQIKYRSSYRAMHFWRTYSGVEMDYVEIQDQKIAGYEFKWGPKTPKVPITWVKNYPDADYQVVNQTNFLDFVLGID